MKRNEDVVLRFGNILESPLLWSAISLLALSAYLFPIIFHSGTINTLVFDNLDSNVVWNKILAESGMIFAPNDAVIPNMMNGLPRLSYGSEFSVILWLYYFFTPETAYAVNIVLIHLTAFVSMYLLLERYIVRWEDRFRYAIINGGALLFAVQPFWPSAGVSIAIMPLVTYILANIYYRREKKYEWALLLLVPLYTSLVFVYLFYLGYVFLFIVYNLLRHKRMETRLLLALLIMSAMYLLVEYRLVLATFFNHGFVSHRTAFDIYFSEPFIDATRRFYLFFLDGHLIHARGLQMPILLPFVLFSIGLQFFGRRLNHPESLILISLFAVSIWLDVWPVMLGSIYSIPAIVAVVVLHSILKKKMTFLNAAMLLMIIVSAFYGYAFYNGLHFITEWLPLAKSLSLARAGFVQPMVFGVLLALAMVEVSNKLRFRSLILATLLGAQLILAFEHSWHRLEPVKGLSSFQNYYAPRIFASIKKDIPEKIDAVRFVSFGLEPAVALYNGLYTVDGYCTNYPLSYQKQFEKVNKGYSGSVTDDEGKDFTDVWGSKLYIMSIASAFERYQKGLFVARLDFDERTLKQLGTNYLLSSYQLTYPQDRQLVFIKKYPGAIQSWDIYLYRFEWK